MKALPGYGQSNKARSIGCLSRRISHPMACRRRTFATDIAPWPRLPPILPWHDLLARSGDRPCAEPCRGIEPEPCLRRHQRPAVEGAGPPAEPGADAAGRTPEVSMTDNRHMAIDRRWRLYRDRLILDPSAQLPHLGKPRPWQAARYQEPADQWPTGPMQLAGHRRDHRSAPPSS